MYLAGFTHKPIPTVLINLESVGGCLTYFALMVRYCYYLHPFLLVWTEITASST